MARTNKGAGGASYVLSLMVVFVMAFVVTAGMLIVSISANDKLTKDRDAAVNDLKAYVSKGEQSSPDVQEIKARKDSDGSTTSSVYHKLQDEIKAYKMMIFGTPTASLETIDSELAALGIDPKNNTFLVSEIKSLRGQLQFAKAGTQDLTARRQEAEQRAADALTAKQQTEQGGLKLVDDLRGNLTDLQQKFVAYQAEVDAHNKDTEQQIQQIRQESKKSLEEDATKLAQDDQIIDNLRAEIRKMQSGRLGQRNVAIHPELAPKGSIISVDKDDRLVYIDRGRDEHIILGMTFEVFDKLTGVVADAHDKDNLRGKATIEVVSMAEHSSACRIVRIEPTTTLIEGDVIANLVYDPRVQNKFVVFGEFDIDNTGQATVSDRRRIETMISEWGGTLTDTLTYDTDFVVLGKEPILPDPLPQGTVDPEPIQRHSAQLKKYDDYQKIAKTAKDLGIPVLNQNRFLSLVGYYHR